MRAQANPVVVRQTMAGLREAGLVRAKRGRSGGWSIARDLPTIAVRDVHAALGAPSVFAVGLRNRQPGSLVEQAVKTTLESAFSDAEALLMDRLGAVTLASLAADLQRRVHARGHHGTHPPSEQ